jgi:hypothetical protein
MKRTKEQADRRERIATAAMIGLITHFHDTDDAKVAHWAAMAADALIAELDREAEENKP